jgi:hypothetical protein
LCSIFVDELIENEEHFKRKIINAGLIYGQFCLVNEAV